MKKVVWGIVFFFLFSIRVNAASISTVVVSGDKEKKIGEEGSIQISVNFSGIPKGWDQPLGIWMVGIELKSDDAIKLTNVSAPGFVSVLSYDSDENVYYVLSQVSENANQEDLCAEGNLYCSNYNIKVNYVVKDTKKTTANVEVIDTEALLLNMTENREYTEEDAISIEFPSIQKYKLTIKQQTSSKNSNSNVTTKPTVNTKSENKYLKSIEIENYPIEFDKQKTDYTITVDEGIHKLNIKAVPEDKNATYKVVGADNLNDSKNIVRIEVTAQDSTKLTYYIRVKYAKKEQILTNQNSVEEKVSNEESTHSNILKWVGIGAGVLVGLGLVIFIISKIKDRAIDKKLEALDDD